MKVLQQIFIHNLPIIAVHKIEKIFLLFTADGIYAYGDEKEITKFQNYHLSQTKKGEAGKGEE
jgi:hypothetical protein